MSEQGSFSVDPCGLFNSLPWLVGFRPLPSPQEGITHVLDVSSVLAAPLVKGGPPNDESRADPLVGEGDRKRMALAMFRLTVEILKDIESAQQASTEPVVKDGKVGAKPIAHFAAEVMLHFLSKEKLIEEFALDDGLRIMDEILEQADSQPV